MRFKGKRMPGRMGHDQVTVKNLVVAYIDAENNLIGLKGAVPGPKKGIVTVIDGFLGFAIWTSEGSNRNDGFLGALETKSLANILNADKIIISEKSLPMIENWLMDKEEA